MACSAFTVSLSVAAAEPVTVSYATADGTATASEDYQSTSGTLTFPAGSNQARQVEVPISDDRIDEGAETFTLQLSDPHGATLAVGAATATIADAPSITGEPNDDDESESAALELASLQVTGGASAVYPAFAAATHHYALTCHDSTTLRVTAQATSSAVSLTLLRDDPNDNHTSAGSLDGAGEREPGPRHRDRAARQRPYHHLRRSLPAAGFPRNRGSDKSGGCLGGPLVHGSAIHDCRRCLALLSGDCR